MTTLYMGVSPASDDTLGIENGVYMRLGSYVSDPAEVDEASHLPTSVYSGGLAASDGIFITTAGSYIVEASKEGHIEIGGSLTQKNRDGHCNTTVGAGDVTITTDTKGFSLTARGNSKFNVTSHHVDGIFIEAPDGKVSSKGDAIYNHTFGAYLKQVVGSTKKIIQKESTNVSLALVLPVYLSGAVGWKMCSMNLKVFDASETDLKISSGGIKLGFVYLSNNVITHDMGYSILYYKKRGIQLEYAVKKNDLKGWSDFFSTAKMKTALAQSQYTSSVEAHIGIESKMPA
ncbi:hypothetical protein [Labrenzia sp. VG12]|uniref:hypothetical protein n=1 Tax=Labrenzia sp. VG12 TaxID=2021862 RepID=UPI0012FD2AB3|nr:hypothetical protein [Labrenzia sp. VG12]